MTRLVGVEFFKLRKRMMTWVVAAVLVGLVVLLYAVLWNVSGEATKRLGYAGRFTGADLRRVLFVQFSVPFSLQLVGWFGAVLAVIFAAGAAGGEYSWGTVRLMATCSNGRIRLITARLFVVCAMVTAAVWPWNVAVALICSVPLPVGVNVVTAARPAPFVVTVTVFGPPKVALPARIAARPSLRGRRR